MRRPPSSSTKTILVSFAADRSLRAKPRPSDSNPLTGKPQGVIYHLCGWYMDVVEMTEMETVAMSDQMQGGMAEAMRLMQEGGLAEATAVIQRTLGGSSLGSGFAPMVSPDAPSGAGRSIDEESSVVDEAP